MNEEKGKAVAGNVADLVTAELEAMQAQVASATAIDATTHGMPALWPRFKEGEELIVKGMKFELARINAATLVLRPKCGPDQSARQIVSMLVRASSVE